MTPVQQSKINTSLPYCLYKVDTRYFKLNDKHNSKIRFDKIETTPNRRLSSSYNTQTIRDRWGIDAHSDVEIYTDKEFEDLLEAEKFALKIINKFVKLYRYHNRDDVHLVPLNREDLFGLTVESNNKGIVGIHFAGGITLNNPMVTHVISTKIENDLTNNTTIPLWEDLLLNAEQYIYQTEYRHSILESIIALELVVSDYIRKKFRESGTTEDKAEKLLKDIGLTGNLDVMLPFLVTQDKPSKKLLSRCKSSITTRNFIVHRGLISVSEAQAKQALNSSKELITYIMNH